MTVLRRIFGRKRSNEMTVVDDSLPPHVYAAIGAASLHIRENREDERPPIVTFSNGASLVAVAGELNQRISACFPGMSEGQILAASKFLQDRIVARRRMQAELSQQHGTARQRWSATEW